MKRTTEESLCEGVLLPHRLVPRRRSSVPVPVASPHAWGSDSVSGVSFRRLGLVFRPDSTIRVPVCASNWASPTCRTCPTGHGETPDVGVHRGSQGPLRKPRSILPLTRDSCPCVTRALRAEIRIRPQPGRPRADAAKGVRLTTALPFQHPHTPGVYALFPGRVWVPLRSRASALT